MGVCVAAALACLAWWAAGTRRAEPLGALPSASVVVIGEPPGEVWVEGRPAGSSPIELRLSGGGTLRLELRTADRPPRVWRGSIRAGERRVVEFGTGAAPESWVAVPAPGAVAPSRGMADMPVRAGTADALPGAQEEP